MSAPGDLDLFGGGPGSGAAPVVELPRELVLASAGSGKTFRISSRIIGLLEAGEEPDRILASTFARKAAGEILNRVLERLARAALDDDAAAELSGHALLPGRASPVGRQRWLALLADLVRRLHRANVGTLDAFFVRTARSFSAELGLPPTWSIADEPTAGRLETDALHDVLGSADRGEVVELVRALMRGEAGRRVQERLLEQATGLRAVLHELEPAADEPWAPFEVEAGPPDAAERQAAAEAIDALEPAPNKSGTPNARWAAELPRAAEAVRAGDWEGLVDRGLGKKVLAEEAAYSGKPIRPEVQEAFREALDLARRALAADYAGQARALERLGVDFDAALHRRQRTEGAYRFDDVTRMLGGADPLTTRPDLWYRLDQRARHLLLDEFQDTSVSQWLALRPLAEELLSGHRDERSAVIVADPKQSIYGWRGAEPGLVEHLGARFALERQPLHHSWRSSEQVLGLVNAVFGDLPANPVWDDVPGDRAVVEEWAGYFELHAPAPGRGTVPPGRVVVEAGPRDEEIDRGAKARPRMMERAAERVARIRERAPGATVGVLTRYNEAVSRVIAELRARGVEASEEGGTRLTDSPAVVAVLALLRMADHPGHTIARYHVAATPLGRAVGFTDHADAAAARRLARRVRRSLLREGYGPTLDRWTRELGGAGALDARELRRMLQLVEAGFRWEERATLRPGDFVRFVEAERVEDPLAAPVRVMTVHRAKGLEFDVVVMPELDTRLTGMGAGAPPVLPERDPATSRIRRVFPYVSKSVRPLFPEIEEAYRQHRASELRDALGVFYVGLTRARHALHVLVAADDPERGPRSTATFARLLREALGRHDETVEEGEVLYEDGPRRWFEGVERAARPSGAAEEAPAPEVRFVRRPRARALPHRTPSELEGGSRVRLADVLELGPARDEARAAGTLVHEWCRLVGWLDEEGPPDEARLLEVAGRVAPELPHERIWELADRFRGWLEATAVRQALSRPEAAGAELRWEVPFAVRLDQEIHRGAIDRMVLLRDAGGGVAGARILDFKTDRVDPHDVDHAVDRYGPQLDAYRRAVRRMHGLEREAVSAALVLLRAGVVEEI